MELRRDEPVTAEQHTIPALGPGSGGLSARAVAALLGVHERTISRAIRDGRLVATKHGRSYVITPEALRRYRDAHGESQRVEWAPRRPNLTLLRDPGTRAPEPAARMPKFSPAGTMPRLLTSFVGREWELAAIGELMATGPRLLTLTGPGGVGKTRLAIAAATAIAPAFADGVVFVPLAAITEPGLVLPTISRALDIRETPGRPLTKTLAEALQDWRVLLVLDNFEHVLVAAADLARLLEACPGLTALVTSRAPLRLSVEQRFLTPPLTLPAPGHTLADGGLAGNEAIALFVERARSVRHDFAVDGGNAAQLVEICRRLDGLPLAIELAAAWVRVLPPAALLSRLDQRLSLLHGAIDEQPLRLRTMRDAIAWSYDLLAPDEARLFRRLAVFVGGFTLETAEHVAQGERRDSPSPHDPITPSPTSTLDLLAAFIDKSLLQLNADQPDPRYLMLETVREFALERLEEAAEATSIRDRHATWCLELATRAEPELSGAQQTIWFARLETEHPNLRAALSWHLEQGDAEQGLRLASALAWFWSSRGHFREASQWFEAFLAMPTTALTRGRGLVDAANILHWQGDDDQAMAYADEALAICQAHGDQLFTLYALRRLASLAIDREELDRAAAFLAESDELVRSVGSAWDAAFTIFLSGRLASAAEKSDEAVGRFAEAAEAFRAIGDRGYVAAALGQQGAASLRIGALPAAAAAYAESLELAHALKDQPWVAWASVGAAHLAHDAGESAIAARLLGAATAIREAIGERRLPKSALDREVRSTLGEEQFVSEWSHGMRMSETEVVAEARIILGSDGFQPLAQVRHGPAQESTLTPREQEVLRLLVAGHADKEIAAALAISRTTVSRHVAAIRAKLDAPSRGAAVAIAVRDRLI